MITATFADNGLGTGGVVTIAGGSPTATNELWISRFLGTNEQRYFQSVGTRLGNGTIALTATPGPFLMVCVSTDGPTVELTDPVAMRVRSTVESVHYRVAEAIREFILSLALPGVATNPNLHLVAKVGAKLEELVRDNDSCVYYLPVTETIQGLDNLTSTISYPVTVVFNKRSGQRVSTNIKDILASREMATLAFGKFPLPDVPEVHTVLVQPGVTVDPSKWALNYDVSVLTFTALSEQYDSVI